MTRQTYLVIGSFVCERLLAEGHKVICIDNFLTGQKKNIENLLTNPNFTLIESDVSKNDWRQRINALTFFLPSLAYGFSAWMSVWIEWNIHGFVYALLPWALLCIYRHKTIPTIFLPAPL